MDGILIPMTDSIWSGIGAHQLEIRDSNGCSINYATIIEPAERGELQLNQDTIGVILGDSVWFDATTLNIDSLVSIKWFGPGYISCAHCLTTAVFITEPINEYLILVMDNNGCIYERSVVVVSKQNFYLPNVFSPNGDNINDHFNLFTDRSIEFIEQLQIFDRWGNRLFESKNFPPNGIEGAWTGEVAGQKAMPGVYVYLFRFKDKAGKYHQLSGDVSLIR
jgi:gliding motility-associated-like protein